jgi:hypothetical protein
MSTSITVSDTILRTRSRPGQAALGQAPGGPAWLSRPQLVRHRAPVASDDYTALKLPSQLRSRLRSSLIPGGQL